MSISVKGSVMVLTFKEDHTRSSIRLCHLLYELSVIIISWCI